MLLPLELVGLGRAELRIVWDTGHEGTFSARDLRLSCRCAHCVHELTGERLLDPNRIPARVTIEQIDLVGAYGIQVTFSDGHNTGIYRFDTLLGRCPCAACRAQRGV